MILDQAEKAKYAKDLEAPEGLSAKGKKAHAIVMAFMEAHGYGNTGGCKAFYSPKEWKARGESYGRESKLILCHDGGDLYYLLNLDAGLYELHDKLQAEMHKAGLFIENCTGWYSAVYEG